MNPFQKPVSISTPLSQLHTRLLALNTRMFVSFAVKRLRFIVVARLICSLKFTLTGKEQRTRKPIREGGSGANEHLPKWNTRMWSL